MQITTFFIDRFKEVSLTSPEGFQEQDGVYGIEDPVFTPTPWELGSGGDTADFLGITKTNILYGELFKITLDTGGIQNAAYRNMTLDDYWYNITEGIFKFNGLDYRTLIKNQRNQRVYPTLIEYATAAKQKVGWVEVNRTRASIYYEICSDGKSKRARSDHFYDIDKFIMTPELFNPDGQLQIGMFNYSFINPYRATQASVAAGSWGGENFVTSNAIGVFSPVVGGQPGGIQRIGLIPVDSWFTWQNTQQAHTRTIKNIPDGANNGGVFDMFPWPRPVEISEVLPQNYLKLLVTGNKRVLDATIDGGPTIVTQKVPSGLGEFNRNIPLLLASKEKHLNLLMGDRLAVPTQFGVPNPISPVYSVDIWGERRTPENIGVIPVAIKSTVQTPSVGVCQRVQGLEGIVETTTTEDLTIRDPFGLELYELDKQYKEIYDTFKFCPPRKKVKYTLDTKPTPVQPTNKNVVTKVKTGNTEEYNLPDLNIIRIGPFNPDANFSIDTRVSKTIEVGHLTEIKYKGIESSIKYYTENPDIDNGDNIFDTPAFLTKSPSSKTYFDDPEYSYVKRAQNEDSSNSFYNELEIERGIRDTNDFLLTSTEIPYGTYSHNVEKSVTPDGLIKRTVKILQNGSDADSSEFARAVSNITTTAGNNKVRTNPIGVKPDGFPIYPKNTLEESISKLKEELLGIKEIIFRGSEVNYGAVSFPISKDITSNQNYFEPVKKFEYVNTGISVSGIVDLSAGQKIGDSSNIYYYRRVQEKSGDILYSGEIRFFGLNNSLETDIDKITHIVISKTDALKNVKNYWPINSSNNKNTPILSASSGTLFLETFGPSSIANNYIFNIVGTPLEIQDGYYRIPVKFVSATYKVLPSVSDATGAVKFIGIKVLYSTSVENKKPLEQKSITSKENTYGGWVFNGLYHRDGAWPKDHKFRSGLINFVSWSPCDGAIDTGAWLKVPRERVLLEYHDFSINARDTVYSYIHDSWLSEKQRQFLEENSYKPGQDNVMLMPDIPFGNIFQPDPLNSEKWEDWERVLDTIRREMVLNLKDLDTKVLIIRLRDNDPDKYRGLNELPTAGRGYLLENGIKIIQLTSDEKIMDSRNNYYPISIPEPEDHVKGLFKKDEWYKAVFYRSVVSPSNPGGDIAGSNPVNLNQKSCRELFESVPDGKYKPNDKNKQTLCDLIYVSEQILKMHRARLVKMKEYIDNKKKFVDNSNEPSLKKTFKRSMNYVLAIKELTRFFK